MAEEAKLDLNEYIDGVIPSMPPGTKDSVTFVTTSPYQSVNCDGGFVLQFAGRIFTHTHPRVIQILRGLSKRNVGIFEAAAEEVAETAQVAQAAQEADKAAAANVPTGATVAKAAAAPAAAKA